MAVFGPFGFMPWECAEDLCDKVTDYLLIGGDIWDGVEETRAKEARKHQRHMAALGPELPPTGTVNGKTIMPRARRNLPQGVRNRFGKDEA